MSTRLPKGLVTINQAKKLKKLGYNKETVYYTFEEHNVLKVRGHLGDHNHRIRFVGTGLTKTFPFVSIPTLDEVIDWYISNETKNGRGLFYRLAKYKSLCVLEVSLDTRPYFYAGGESIIKCKRKFVNKIIKDITKTKQPKAK